MPALEGFANTLRTLRAESTKKFALTGFTAPTPQEVVSMFDAKGIASVEDLRAFAIEELQSLQAWLRTAETNPLSTYYQDGKHVDENTARNRVVDSLTFRMTAMNMPVVIEHHMAGSNRCDFTVSAMIEGRRRLLVVEAKGQWHEEVFTAASDLIERALREPPGRRAAGNLPCVLVRPGDKGRRACQASDCDRGRASRTHCR